MNRDWLQILSNVGVILGLLFLAYQIIQDRNLKRAEMIGMHYQDSLARDLAMMGEDPASTLSKLSTGKCLDARDQMIAIAYYDARFQEWDRNQYIQDIGLFTGSWWQNLNLTSDTWRNEIAIDTLRTTARLQRFSEGFRSKISQAIVDLEKAPFPLIRCEDSDDA